MREYHEYIDRDEFLEDLTNRYCEKCDANGSANCLSCWIDNMMCEVGDAAYYDDLEQVVRCKDCDYAQQIDYDSKYDYECGYHDRLTYWDCFCNYGERRDDNG